MNLDDAELVLRLEIEVAEDNRERFLAFCRRAFPVYESTGGVSMRLYEHLSARGRFDEVAFYRTRDDHRRSEEALQTDPAQAALIREWRALLASPPKVLVTSRIPVEWR